MSNSGGGDGRGEGMDNNPLADMGYSGKHLVRGEMPQISAIKRDLSVMFDGIDLSYVDELMRGINIPDDEIRSFYSRVCYGNVIVPKISYLGKIWNIEDPYQSGYHKIFLKVCDLLASREKLTNRISDQFETDRFISIGRSVVQELRQIENMTTGDVLGMSITVDTLLARNSSILKGNWHLRSMGVTGNVKTECFPLGLVQVGSMLLVAPDVLEPDVPASCIADHLTESPFGIGSTPCFVSVREKREFQIRGNGDSYSGPKSYIIGCLSINTVGRLLIDR